MIFSVTDRQTYKRCRRKWDYSSKARQNLTRIGSGAPALELGGLVHRALAAWILEPTIQLSDLFTVQAAARVVEIETDYEARVGAKIDNAELAPVLDTFDTGVAMMKNYQEHHGTPIPANMRFAAAEQEIVVPIPGTEHSLSATLDGLLQDANDKLYILEHKTYSQRPRTDLLSVMDQFTGYAWIVQQLNIGRIGGIAFDGMWKKAKPPRGSTMQDLFLRLTIRKTPAELEEWGRNLALEVNEMADNPALYPNIPWNGCLYDCAFLEPCTAKLKGEDDKSILNAFYIQRQIVRVQGVRDEDEV